MIEPIYFPFTCVAESVARNLSRLLGRILVFQPIQGRPPESLRRCEANGWIDVKAPWTGDEDQLMAFFNEFKDWDRRLHGSEASLKAAFEAGFYNQAFVSQIRTDIVKNQEKTPEAPEPGFMARLFLIMAQDLDVRQMEIARDLALSADHELDLFIRMTGKKILDGPGETLFNTDSGAYMTGQRLAAWFRLLGFAGTESAFLITDSPAVESLLKDRLKDMEMIVAFDGVAWQQPEDIVQKFNQRVAHQAVTPWPGRLEGEIPDLVAGDGQDVSFKLYMVPGSAPEDLGRFFFKTDDQMKSNKNKWLNTLIGIVETSGKKYKNS